MLTRCPISSQVSRAWRVLAEDGVLWFKMCTGEGYHQDASVSDSPCWKSTLRDCRNSAKTVCSNWKVGSSCSAVVNQNHSFAPKLNTYAGVCLVKLVHNLLYISRHHCRIYSRPWNTVYVSHVWF